MTDTAIEKAVAVRDEMAEKITTAEEQVKEWRATMQRAERFISDWEEFSGEKAPKPEVSVKAHSDGIKKEGNFPTRKAKNPKKEEVAEFAREILRERGQPMSRDELFEALPSKGITIQGQNPPVVLQTMLWRMKDVIVHLKGHGYWPTDTAWPDAEYDPAPTDEFDENEALEEEADSLT